MPRYELRCKVCGYEFEVIFPITGEKKRRECRCERCRGRTETLISGGATVTVRGGTPRFYSSCGTQRKWTGSSRDCKELATQRIAGHPQRPNRERAYTKHGRLKPFWHEDLGIKPVYITSTRQYRDELTKRGLANPAIGHYGRSF